MVSLPLPCWIRFCKRCKRLYTVGIILNELLIIVGKTKKDFNFPILMPCQNPSELSPQNSIVLSQPTLDYPSHDNDLAKANLSSFPVKILLFFRALSSSKSSTKLLVAASSSPSFASLAFEAASFFEANNSVCFAAMVRTSFACKKVLLITDPQE